jgi:uncharacterized RDD family membrane protein YckC
MTDPSSAPPPPPGGGFAPPPAPGGFAAPAPMAGAMPGGGLQLSSPWKRLGAQFLEGLLIIVTLVIGWLVWWIIAWGKGQTPAKQLLRMRCVRVDENRPASFGEMALRELVGKALLSNVTFGISTLVGGIMILADDTNRQAVWDKIAGTTVVEDPNNAFGL